MRFGEAELTFTRNARINAARTRCENHVQMASGHLAQSRHRILQAVQGLKIAAARAAQPGFPPRLKPGY
jgi:hypothetical protein